MLDFGLLRSYWFDYYNFRVYPKAELTACREPGSNTSFVAYIRDQLRFHSFMISSVRLQSLTAENEI